VFGKKGFEIRSFFGLVIALLLVNARGSGASSFYVARRVIEALI